MAKWLEFWSSSNDLFCFLCCCWREISKLFDFPLFPNDAKNCHKILIIWQLLRRILIGSYFFRSHLNLYSIWKNGQRLNSTVNESWNSSKTSPVTSHLHGFHPCLDVGNIVRRPEGERLPHEQNVRWTCSSSMWDFRGCKESLAEVQMFQSCSTTAEWRCIIPPEEAKTWGNGGRGWNGW